MSPLFKKNSMSEIEWYRHLFRKVEFWDISGWKGNRNFPVYGTETGNIKISILEFWNIPNWISFWKVPRKIGPESSGAMFWENYKLCNKMGPWFSCSWSNFYCMSNIMRALNHEAFNENTGNSRNSVPEFFYVPKIFGILSLKVLVKAVPEEH